MVAYARSVSEQPLHLTQTQMLCYLPDGADPEDVYDGIAFKHGSGHEVWQQLVTRVQRTAQDTGIFDAAAAPNLNTWAFSQQSARLSRIEWQAWGDARAQPWAFRHPG